MCDPCVRADAGVVCAGMVEEEVPKFVNQVFGALIEGGIFSADEAPNHVLINSYECGQVIKF